MNIAIEAIRITDPGGAGVYSYQIIKNILALDQTNRYILLTSKWITDFALPNCQQVVIKASHRWILRLKFLFWGHWILRKEKAQLLHCTSNWALFFAPCPIIVTIHDIISIIRPDLRENPLIYYYINKLLHYYTINKVRGIITVSQNTKMDLLRYYQINPDRIKVIYNGFDKQLFNINNKNDTKNLLKLAQIPKKYILYVGHIIPNKNLETLIRAFALFHNEFPDYRLIIVGQLGQDIPGGQKYPHKVKLLIEQLGLSRAIKMMGYLDKSLLPLYYKNASLFIFPSYYEGFGIPPLEAMACGVPVIVSNTSSLPEVVSDAGLTFSPESETELLQGMKRIILDQDLRTSLISKGLKRVQAFDWKKAASETMELYKRLV
jgi:glycosyltransferase involved in cell wall biosynthesis